MLDLFNIAKPQGCDIQTFYADQGASTVRKYSWLKPRGVSNIYMLLIGGGSPGDGSTGGSSGAVTVWYGSAQNVPDSLIVTPGRGGTSTVPVGSDSFIYILTSAGAQNVLNADGAPSTGVAGPAMTANRFAASGFFQSVAGQAGSSGVLAASGTTFLSGGGPTGGVTANYGYSVANNAGFFFMQPIIVGVGGSGGNRGGIGCGGGLNSGLGGQGMVLIASW